MGKWKGAWEGLLRKIWGKPSVSPEKHRESVNLRRKISSAVKCCWQFKQRRHEDMSIGCNYMNSLVGSFGNMVNTSLNEAVGDEGRLVWVQEWQGEEREMMWSLPQWEESSVTWWSTVGCHEKVRRNRVSILQVVRAQEKDLPWMAGGPSLPL